MSPTFSVRAQYTTLLIVGAIICLVGIPLALVLGDPTLLMATIFSSIEVLATIVYPFVWSALLSGTSPDFSVLFVLLTVGWWLYLYLIGWRKRKEQ